MPRTILKIIFRQKKGLNVKTKIKNLLKESEEDSL